MTSRLELSNYYEGSKYKFVGLSLPALAVVLLLGAFYFPALIGLIFVIVGAASVFLIKPSWLVYATVVLAIVTVPTQIPMFFGVMGFTVYLYEVTLVAAFFAVLSSTPSLASSVLRRVLVLTALLIAFSFLGLAKGHEIVRVIGDVRPLVYLLLAYFIACKIAGTPVMDRVIKLLPPTLCFSAAVSVLASVAGLAVSGRGDVLGGIAAGESAVRLLTPATYPATAVLCGVICLLLAGRVPAKSTLKYAIPALVIVFLSFSRNSLIAIAVAVLFGLLAVGIVRSVPTMVRFSVFVIAAVASAILLASFMRGTALGDWLSTQIWAYNDRVFGGLSGSDIREDSSAQYRLVQENPYLLKGISDSPIIGHGFGYPYKPLLTGRVYFSGSEALRYYAHNFYLWLPVKAGVVGMVAFVYAVIFPVISSVRSANSSALAAGAAGAGLLASSIVAPMPLANNTAVLLGSLVGVCAMWQGSADIKDSDDARVTPNGSLTAS
ncbi:O-antigen ligase family protein [Rhodococcus rhodochrous]|uniref:O-antigen ligase family protein n=1 Tax=Rhodococcus rhodochrous TaxID=1829 RepID=UPI0011AE633E|nr:O-antigen ligase family protein [Rhodococcus rhodochrous]